MKLDYRSKAMKLFPWVCGKCGRDFAGKKLKELTVHHKDHDFTNNPADGSNWELLCIYCHDNEHSRGLESQWLNSSDSEPEQNVTETQNPFASLNILLKGSGTQTGDNDRD